MNMKCLKVHASKLDRASLVTPSRKGASVSVSVNNRTIDTVRINQYPAEKPVLSLYDVVSHIY